MGDGGLAAWRHSCCGPFWSPVCPLVGAGCGGFISGFSRCGRRSRCLRQVRGLGRRVCCLPGLVAVLGLYVGPFLLLSRKIYMYIEIAKDQYVLRDVPGLAKVLPALRK